MLIAGSTSTKNTKKKITSYRFIPPARYARGGFPFSYAQMYWTRHSLHAIRYYACDIVLLTTPTLHACAWLPTACAIDNANASSLRMVTNSAESLLRSLIYIYLFIYFELRSTDT